MEVPQKIILNADGSVKLTILAITFNKGTME